MSENYNYIPPTTATHYFNTWHKITVRGIAGMFIVKYWVMEHYEEISGDYRQDGNSIWFEREKDAVYFNLTIKRIK